MTDEIMSTIVAFYFFGAFVVLVVWLLSITLLSKEKLRHIWEDEGRPAISFWVIALKLFLWPIFVWRVIARVGEGRPK